MAPPKAEMLAGALSDEAASVVERVKASVAVVYQNGGNGAGVVWRPDGTIVTNSHVVREKRAEVVLADGRHFVGVVASRHSDRDLAVVKIAADDLSAIEVGDSTTVRPGQLVFAIGHPFGYRNAVTAGIVVAAGQAATPSGPRTGDHLQADVALGPGNSGGPLIDAEGKVIGVNAMVSGHLALAIPSHAVENFVAGGRDERTAFLGLQGIVVPLRRPDHAVGFLITNVTDGAPADRAGLIVGDVILAIGTRRIVDQESMPAALLRLTPGDAVAVETLRGGEPRTFVVVPTEKA
jgi:serine protease Do